MSDDLAALKHDVARLLVHLKNGAADGLHESTDQINDGIKKIYRTAATERERSVKAISQQIEKQPLMVLLLIFGIGYLRGRFTSR